MTVIGGTHGGSNGFDRCKRTFHGLLLSGENGQTFTRQGSWNQCHPILLLNHAMQMTKER